MGVVWAEHKLNQSKCHLPFPFLLAESEICICQALYISVDMTLYSTEKMFVDSEISVGRDEHLWIVFSDFHRLQSNKIDCQLS